MINIRRKFLVLILSALVLSPCTAWAEKVVLQLRWDHQFQFAGYYAALWQGYYRDAGLDVEIRSVFEPNGKFHKVIKEVAEGRADFGTGAIDIVQARNDGIPLVVVASIFQQSPVAFFAKAGTQLDNPADLAALRVATRGSGGMAMAELRAMLRAENIDPALVRLQTIREKLGLFDLAKGHADVVSGFTISAGWVAKEVGLSVRNLRPAAYGVDFYGSALFTHQRLVDANPELVQRFKTASLKGWKYALDNPDEIITGITEKLKRKIPIKDTRGFNAFQAEEVRKLTNYPVVQFGHTNPERWRKMHAALVDLGLAKGKFQPARFIFDLEAIKRQSEEHNFKIIFAILGLFILFALAGWLKSFVSASRERKKAETALRESEDLLNSIFENVPVGLLIKDRGHIVERANSTYLNWYGFGSEVMAGLRSDEIEDFQHAEEAELMNAQEREVLSTGKTQSRQVERSFADGQFHTINITKFPVYDQQNNITKVGSVSVDLTEQVQAQKAADVALQEAERANQAKSEFLAAMSHDLRTPLNAILGFADILSQQYFGHIDDKYREYAEDILSSGEHLLALVNEILDLSTIEAGKQSLVKENLSTAEIVKECARIVGEKAYNNGINLVTEIPEDIAPIYADKRASKQILLNLFSNAVKFTPEGGKITVSAEASDRDITLKIADTGKGIPSEKIPNLTDPFSRGDSDPFLSEKGWGLGLTITKSLVDLHDGTLDIESVVGKGTIVSVILPNAAVSH